MTEGDRDRADDGSAARDANATGRDAEASARDGFTPVRARTVIEHWLSLEAEKPEDPLSPESLPDLSDAVAHDALLKRKPGAAAIFHEAPGTRWYRLRLRGAEVGRLRYVSGPADALWGALAEDRRLVVGARRVGHADPEILADETGIDVDHVLAVRDRVASGASVPVPVLATRRGRTPTRILDGNHRLTAVALHGLETGSIDSLDAYLGVRPNRVATPLMERALGVVERLLGWRRF